MTPSNIIDAMHRPEWWAKWFERGDWSAWRVFLSALFAMPIGDEGLSIFRECTGRTAPPSSPAREAWAICGRRGGKTRIMASVAAWLACFVDWRPYLAPGEIASVMVIAADRRQARVAMRYLRSLIIEHPTLSQLVTRESDETIELSCRVVIEVATASFRTTRGYTIAAVLADEVAFWFDGDTSANPASEILVALRAAMATMPLALLMVATTPYARRGSVYETWRRHWAKDDDPILVWRAPTRRMNPSVPQSLIDEALEDDPARAAAEYLAEFRTDVETFIPREVVEAATATGRHELPRMGGTIYRAFADPSGGSSDSFTLAIAHRDSNGLAVLDAVRERRPPFSPEACVEEFAELLKAYGLRRVTGDRYAGEWPRERFSVHGIQYEVSEMVKSDIYRDFLPLINSGKIELLDHARLCTQLCALERRTARGGRDSIDHAPGAHDDVANSVAGALVLAAGKRPLVIPDSLVASSAQPSVQTRHRHGVFI